MTENRKRYPKNTVYIVKIFLKIAYITCLCKWKNIMTEYSVQRTCLLSRCMTTHLMLIDDVRVHRLENFIPSGEQWKVTYFLQNRPFIRLTLPTSWSSHTSTGKSPILHFQICTPIVFVEIKGIRITFFTSRTHLSLAD